MKIHISTETKQALEEFQSFVVEERGKVEMKVIKLCVSENVKWKSKRLSLKTPSINCLIFLMIPNSVRDIVFSNFAITARR